MTALLPPDLALGAFLLLMLSSLMASFITAAFGIGGGVLLLAVMTVFLPVSAVIPLHGVIQAGANLGRVGLLWRYVRWPVWLAFTGGSVLGIAAGAQILVELPAGGLELLLGGFILWSCWGPTPRLHGRSFTRLGVGGAVTSLATLFVGATGPFVGALIRAMKLDRRDHVGTFSACMVMQHGLKIVAFGLLGFGFAAYLPFLAAMLAAGFFGTLLGRLVLEKLDDAVFRRILALLLTVLAARLLYEGTVALLG